ncbi:tRNA dimethylallyltransferase [Cimex lectularius]|uniref:U1-type domain-containing protein n=1 Tax=Cimex lectularius TaxID=79782 RepID=A0A8I6RMS2_CIMLE|nr:tRNA dimethylallyltransferase [Cimex lectularius]
MCSKVPVVVILGATGTGKSKLSIEIARMFRGEVISADSMQVYKGLDIITNKVTREERQMAPHHLIDFLSPVEKYKVVDFRDKALPIIERLRSEGKLPIVVGGTHYYIESLLWKVLMDGLPSDADKVTLEICLQDIQDWSAYCDSILSKCLESGVEFPENELSKYERSMNTLFSDVKSRFPDEKKLGFDKLWALIDGLTTDEKIKEREESFEKCLSLIRAVVSNVLHTVGPQLDLQPEREIENLVDSGSAKLHEKLKKLDPEMANSLHPNNKRKIIRSLQVLAQQGRKFSDILQEQQNSGGSYLGGPLRFKDAIMLWIQCQEDVLNKRLDERVDDMVSRGLLKELVDFHETYNRTRIDDMDTSTAYTQGIFQSIGFKEFHEYLILPAEEKDTPKGQTLIEEGISALKTVTRRYARRQKKWINNRFLKAAGRQVPPVYALDATDLSKWDERVFRPAEAILRKSLNPQSDIQAPEPLARVVENTKIDIRVLKGDHFCDICQRIFIGQLQWESHMMSKKHQKMVKKREQERSEEVHKRSKE